jgi:hypothetical protein
LHDVLILAEFFSDINRYMITEKRKRSIFSRRRSGRKDEQGVGAGDRFRVQQQVQRIFRHEVSLFGRIIVSANDSGGNLGKGVSPVKS